MARNQTTPNPHLAQARADAARAGIPREAYDAYRRQYYTAGHRRIGWEFTLPEWWAWWQQDGRWERRGRQAAGLVMARRGDRGPYSPGNVYAATTGENTREVPAARRSEIMSQAFERRGRERKRKAKPNGPLPIPTLPPGWLR